MCCTRLAGNTGHKNDAKNRNLSIIAQLRHAVSSQLRHVLTIGKSFLNSNMSSTCPNNMVNFGPLLASLGHPSKFQPASRLGFITAATSLSGGQPHFVWCLAVFWAGTLYIHFRGLLPADGILPNAKFTLHPTLAFSYIVSVTAWHSTSERDPSFVAWYKAWNYRTFTEGTTYIQLGGHHGGHQPTFYSVSTKKRPPSIMV